MPQSQCSFTVAYAHETERWYARVCSCSCGEAIDYVNHGALTKEFGPFDTAADVLQWVYREASASIRALPTYDVGSAT